MKKSGLRNRVIKGAAIGAGLFVSTKAVIDSFNRFNLRGKVVLITGGSRGLGIVLARQLADEGAKIVICGRSEDSLQEASKELSAKGAIYFPVTCDVTDKQQIKEMVQQVKEEFGNIDVLINNAGIVQVGPMEEMNDEDYEQALKVHFWGPFNLINEVLPGMKNNKNGRIVNVVSIGGKVSFPHLLPYNVSKYALSGFSEGISAELRKYNIKVTTVYPGLMRTGSPRNIDVKGQHEKEYSWFKISDSIPLISVNAERAADKIITAMKIGQKTLTLTFPAKLAVAVHGIAPEITLNLFDLIDYLLPEESGEDQAKKGYESESEISESFLTKKTQEAAEQNLEK